MKKPQNDGDEGRVKVDSGTGGAVPPPPHFKSFTDAANTDDDGDKHKDGQYWLLMLNLISASVHY